MSVCRAVPSPRAKRAGSQAWFTIREAVLLRNQDHEPSELSVERFDCLGRSEFHGVNVGGLELERLDLAVDYFGQ